MFDVILFNFNTSCHVYRITNKIDK